MDNFTYSSLVVIVGMAMTILITFVNGNQNITRKVKRGLTIAFLLIIVGISCEWYCEMIKAGGYLEQFGNIKIARLFKMLARLVKFLMMPMMPIVISKVIFERRTNNRVVKLIEFTLKLYFGIGCFLILVGILTFGASSATDFFESMMYNIYVVTFILSTIYLFVNAFSFNKALQNKYEIEIVEIMIFVAIGVTMQICNLKTKTCWLTIAIASLLIYIYYKELMQCIDGMTGILNQKSFINYLESNKEKSCAIIIFDVNNFKDINDTYGHDFGDEILIQVSIVLKETYQDYGAVYRIGGDEFAVVIQKDLGKIDKINFEFIKRLEEKRKVMPQLPHISYGCSMYNPAKKYLHSLKDTKQEADAIMYQNKKGFKEAQINS